MRRSTSITVAVAWSALVLAALAGAGLPRSVGSSAREAVHVSGQLLGLSEGSRRPRAWLTPAQDQLTDDRLPVCVRDLTVFPPAPVAAFLVRQGYRLQTCG